MEKVHVSERSVQGLLLDDSIVLRLLKKAMTAAVTEGRGSKFLVDGYPR